MTLNHIAVYCGSNLGNSKTYYQSAQAAGAAIARQGSTLVYGGGKIGLMGTVADAALAEGGRVIGVIPTFLLEKEMAHPGLSELIETPDMPSRKSKMIDLADGFIALPGGIGTYEELFEVLSLAQLRRHAKPIGLLNTDGFFDPLIALMQHTADTGFMPQANMKLLCVSDCPQTLLAQMADYRFTESQKWMEPAWKTAGEQA
ncbi:TIGR00730 family Rossman fold protein [Neisseria sp. ZJ106]|uniref:Cytokinin riboside 5'-monophosphate phosphoribohydrolase n=1 Tax=Neisseria lisongii TaxID=2912188 RepID=A0AAW5AI06_9NEIS|nr:TIGR00730 family Rossman fold protein [Neisseria lisongii]MCF7521094.1 TIGR00730 family Rossman fold protein [Neisseria lisongii]MCF7529256.1 TIGR00730 family Rossman fold protein [Neisseria lisongii]WCL72019.1 TIGR00730 family Rossman fold protein [Neisseria lisongii]